MKKLVLLVVLVLIIAAGGIAFYILSQPPKEKLSDEFKQKAVTKLLGRKAQLDAQNVATGNKEYEGKYISFSYPAKALIYTYRNSSTGAPLEDFSFDIKSPKIVFNMRVSEIAGGLEDYPAVRLREVRSEYKKAKLTIDGVAGLTYYKTGQEAEKSGFFVRKGKMYTISITGTSGEVVEKLFDEIISSVSFVE
ncbi:MAG: hypothetical protein Q7T54_01900 [Candidatus Levybacteria bacterium]|nr:hypothetical protein [Candidatus Levybacteria bacterium]